MQIQLHPTQPPVNVYENIIFMSFENIADSVNEQFQQDFFVKLSSQDLRIHCACIAQVLSRNPSFREILEVAVEMSYQKDSTQS